MTMKEKKIGEIAVVANSTQHFNAKLKPQLIRHLCLELSGTLEITRSTGTLTQDSPLGLVKAIRFQSTDGKLLKAINPKNSHFLNKVEIGTPPHISAPATGVAAGVPFSAQIILPFEVWTAIEPLSTILNSNNYADFDLFVDFGAVTDIISNSSALSAKIEIISVEEDSPIENRFTRFLENIDTEQMRTVPGAGILEFLLPEDTEIKTLAIRAIDNGVRSSTLITNVKVDANNGNAIFRDLPFIALQNSNKLDFGYETQDAGFAVVEFDPDGDLKELFDTKVNKTPKLKVTCIAPTGVSEIHILQRQIVTPRA